MNEAEQHAAHAYHGNWYQFTAKFNMHNHITAGLYICMIILVPITKERQLLRQKYKTDKALYYELKSLANIYQ